MLEARAMLKSLLPKTLSGLAGFALSAPGWFDRTGQSDITLTGTKHRPCNVRVTLLDPENLKYTLEVFESAGNIHIRLARE